jgi:hypothetical protein
MILIPDRIITTPVPRLVILLMDIPENPMTNAAIVGVPATRGLLHQRAKDFRCAQPKKKPREGAFGAGDSRT